MAGLKGQMPREQAEDKIAEISNRYFIDNPRIGEVYTINKSINDMKEMNRTESEWSMNKRIKELEFEREEMKELLPREWKTLAGFKPEIIEIDYIEDEQGQEKIMVSHWVAGALKGVEKGLAQRELQRKNDLPNTLKLMTLQSTLASNKLKQEKLIQEKN